MNDLIILIIIKFITSLPNSDKQAIAPNNVESVVLSDWSEFKYTLIIRDCSEGIVGLYDLSK